MSEQIMKIPSYQEALAKHENPLDIFISRWQPVDSKGWADAFREDLEALLEYVIAKQSSHPYMKNCHCSSCQKLELEKT